MRGRRWLAPALGAAASLVLLLVQHAGWLAGVEDVATDLMMRLRGPRPADSRVVICAIDEKSVDRYGRWPWPRTLLARLIDSLTQGGARVIAFDVVFSEPSRSAPGCDLAFEDQVLADAMRRAGNVVLGFFFRRDRPASEVDAGTEPAGLDGAAIRRIVNEPVGGFPVPHRPAVEPNLELFARAAHGQGFFNSERRGGVERHYTLITHFSDRYYPALALAAADLFEGGDRLELTADSADLPRLRLAGDAIETDESGALWIDYRGPAGSFATLPVVDVLEGRVAPGTFRDRVVLVGATETGIGDFVATPFGGEVAGVEIHASVIDNLLDHRFIHDTGVQLLVSLVALLALGPLVAILVATIRRHLVGSLVAIGLVLAWPLACYLAFAGGGWHLQIASPMAAGVLALVATLRYQIGHVESRARLIRRTFARYVSEAIVEEVLRDPERVKLGGERREMTVLFSDIRGFTSISESLDSEQVVQLLNEFFTPMTRVVLEAGGTLDKYMGDALMAFFGAPVRQADHAARACRAALAMRQELVRLNAGWRGRGVLPADHPGLGIGIGLNSGEMSVGNMGSETVFDYTVIGDNVNLGSRIEGLNKLYGTEILVSETTAVAGGGDLLLREVDRVRVKGKQVPVAIFELGAARPAPPEVEARARAFGLALAAYRGREFARAVRLADEILAENADDGPARHLRQRAAAFQADPPADDWDAVENLTTK